MPKESIDPPDNDEIASESGSSKPDTAEKQYRTSSYTLSEKDLEIFGAKAANIEEKHKQVQSLGGIDKIIKDLETDAFNGLGSPREGKYAVAENSAAAVDKVIEEHRRSFGRNSMPNIEPNTLPHFILAGLDDITILILMFASFLSFVVALAEEVENGWTQGFSIVVSILVVSTVAGMIEYAKDKSLSNVDRKSKKFQSIVIREGKRQRVKSEDVVVGDLVILNVGDRVPGDCLMVEEGASLYSCDFSKTAGGRAIGNIVKHTREKDPFIVSGHDVVNGTCRAIIVTVGENSQQYESMELKQMSSADDTPLQRRLQGVANKITYAGIFFSIFVFIAQAVTFGNKGPNEGQSDGQYFTDAIILAATIVVVAIPEGLPMTVAISLGFRAATMLEQQLLVRNNSGNENMGYVTDVLSNKTGTFTKNKMTCAAGWFADLYYSQSDGVPNGKKKFDKYFFQILRENIAQNSSATVSYTPREKKGSKSFVSKGSAFLGKMIGGSKPTSAGGKEAEEGPLVEVYGSQTEGALLRMMIDRMGCAKDFFTNERNVNVRKCFYTFTPKSRFSAAVVEKKTNGNGHRLYIKGAAEVIVARCTAYLDHRAEKQAMDHTKKQYFLNDLIEKMAKAQLRPIALAHCDFDDITKLSLPKTLETSDWVLKQKFVLEAVIGIKDPLRDGISSAVLTCQKAGIKVRMITGEHISAAKAIGTRLGILSEEKNAYTCSDLERMSLSEIDKIMPSIEIIARCPPEFKKKFVSRLNGKALPRNKKEWAKLHNIQESEWDQQASRLLPGYLDEWGNHHVRNDRVVGVVGKHPEDILTLEIGDVGLALAKSSTTGAKLSSDISAMNDSFATILSSVTWGRALQENVRSFLQFQLTTNLVVLSFTVIVALNGTQVPFNAPMLLWVNLIMDTLAAVAFGTEAPFQMSIERLPYRRGAPLINKEMKRNIVIQGLVQFFVLVILLGNSSMFEKNGVPVEAGNVCVQFQGDVFNTTIGEYVQPVSTSPSPSSATQRICKEYDHTHYTILFNTFVFQQVFNFFNARRLEANFVDACKDFHHNITFITVLLFVVIVHITLVESRLLKTSSLLLGHWIACCLIAMFTVLPTGYLLRRFNNTKNDDRTIYSGYPGLVPEKEKDNVEGQENTSEINKLEEGKRSAAKKTNPTKRSKYVV